MSEPVSLANARPLVWLRGEQRDELTAAVHQLQVRLPASGRGNAELTLVNWGRRDGEAGHQWQEIALGDALEIGFFEGGQRVFAGEITAIEERYGEGAPMLVLLAEDRLHRLAKRRRSQVFEGQSPDQVIAALTADLGLPAEVQVSSARGDWHQLNETDLNFLQRLLGRWDIALRIADGRLRIKPEEPAAEPVAVSPQANAQQIRIVADLNHQQTASGVRGWNFQDASALEDQAEQLSPRPQGQAAAGPLGDLGWGEPEWLSWPQPRSPDEAREWAAAGFQRQARRFLHGELLLQGNPALRAGGEIELNEVSERLQGRYRIVHLCHRFEAEQGFVSHLRVERPDWSRA